MFTMRKITRAHVGHSAFSTLILLAIIIGQVLDRLPVSLWQLDANCIKEAGHL